jgi:hypothetical protein
MKRMADVLRVIQFGLGPIGRAVARHVHERSGLELVGGVDINPDAIGKDVGDVVGLGRKLGFPVCQSLEAALAATASGADVVVHTTSSYFDLFKDQILEILNARLDIVSTAEELSFPWLSHADEARQVDDVAKRAGKTVLGTGVNPGYLMDALPLFLTAICQRVERIEVTRVINASLRRGPFQAKIGSGLSVDEFERKMAAGRMGHVGLPESMDMVFDALGEKMVRYEAQVEPVIADSAVTTEHFSVSQGYVRGLRQVARGYTASGEFLTLTFVAALDAGDDGDTIIIRGRPDLEVTLSGTNGDIATVAIAVNAIRRVHEAEPGLVTMRDLPIVTHW